MNDLSSFYIGSESWCSILRMKVHHGYENQGWLYCPGFGSQLLHNLLHHFSDGTGTDYPAIPPGQSIKHRTSSNQVLTLCPSSHILQVFAAIEIRQTVRCSLLLVTKPHTHVDLGNFPQKTRHSSSLLTSRSRNQAQVIFYLTLSCQNGR